MKKLFFLLTMNLFLSSSLNIYADELDTKLKTKYKTLQEVYHGIEIYCRWYKNEGGVIWDIHNIYYILEKNKKLFQIWTTDNGPNGIKNTRLLLGNDKPINITYSSENKIIWNINNIIHAYDKKSKQLIIDFDDKDLNFIRINKHKIGILPKNYRIMDCRYSYPWP
tara:strand:+ start:72 stop:569 length:498 start_codon:yes stop_codon:yes gene_type:complete